MQQQVSRQGPYEVTRLQRWSLIAGDAVGHEQCHQ
jgi:hypothetical protein